MALYRAPASSRIARRISPALLTRWQRRCHRVTRDMMRPACTALPGILLGLSARARRPPLRTRLPQAIPLACSTRTGVAASRPGRTSPRRARRPTTTALWASPPSMSPPRTALPRSPRRRCRRSPARDVPLTNVAADPATCVAGTTSTTYPFDLITSCSGPIPCCRRSPGRARRSATPTSPNFQTTTCGFTPAVATSATTCTPTYSSPGVPGVDPVTGDLTTCTPDSTGVQFAVKTTTTVTTIDTVNGVAGNAERPLRLR